MCDYRRLSAVGGCVVSVQRFSFHHCSTAIFICVLTIQKSKVYKIRDKKSNQMSIIYYRTEVMYSNHNNNIKYVDSNIKYICFKLIHYAINMDIVLFFMIFNDFDYMFISMYS